jgi:hypothetical protein
MLFPSFSLTHDLPSIAVAFLLAFAVARGARVATRRLIGWHDRRASADTEPRLAVATRRRQTLASIVGAAISISAFAAAGIYALSVVSGGFDRLSALLGATMLVAILGISLNRVLTDIVAGVSMFAERWFTVGDAVVVLAPSELQGVVEEMSLRSTTLRSVTGERIHISNSEIRAIRVLPRGVKELAIELFVTDERAGRRLVESVSALLPEGPTTLLSRPRLEEVEVAGELTRLRARARATPGREWLIEDWFCSMLKERAEEGLLVHGPVVMAADPLAHRTYARAARTSGLSRALGGTGRPRTHDGAIRADGG